MRYSEQGVHESVIFQITFVELWINFLLFMFEVSLLELWWSATVLQLLYVTIWSHTFFLRSHSTPCNDPESIVFNI